MKRADAGLAGGRRRAGAGAGRQGAGSTATRLYHLCLAGATAVGGHDVVTVIGRAGRHSQARSGVLTIASLLLLRLVLLGAVAGHVAEAGRHPIEVLFQVAAAAAAAACLEGEIVALLRPKILVTLTLGPAASAAAALEVREHRLLPGVEALAMHELADLAVVIVAGDLDRVVQGVEADEGVAAQALAGRRAAARRLARAQKVVHGIVVGADAATTAPVLQEAAAAASAVAAVGVTPRCHVDKLTSRLSILLPLVVLGRRSSTGDRLAIASSRVADDGMRHSERTLRYGHEDLPSYFISEATHLAR